MKLEIKNLIKKYNDVRALDGFSVTMTQGVYGLLGPNGAGKSTLMNILTDNLKRDDGEILYDGKEILEMGADYRKIVGYMPQEQVGYSQFSAYEFLRYMAVLKGLDIKKTETKEQIDTLLKSVHLYDDRKRKAGGFSGGMKRRLLLAQALLGKPEILILDEPTAGLDHAKHDCRYGKGENNHSGNAYSSRCRMYCRQRNTYKKRKGNTKSGTVCADK